MNPIQKIGIAILKAGFKFWSATKLPKVSGQLKLKGLKQDVEVIRDEWGIPHVYAKDIHDLLFAQGFIHAQDRLWQMETNRRAANGQLSAFIGEDALDADRMSRTFGYARIGAQDWELFPPEKQAYIISFVNGINAFTHHKKYKKPVEFTLAGIKPHHWTPLDIMAMSRLLADQMSWGWYDEIIRAKLIDIVGPEAAAELNNTYPEGHSITLPEGIEYGKIAEPERLHAMEGPLFPHISGSNAWTVSGELTTTGKPFLCNDPHLPITTPSIWYEMHLDCPEMQSAGVSIAGIPLIAIGHNARISWGITLSFTDIEDLFVEKFTDDTCTEYIYKGEPKKAVIFEEAIEVKGRQEPFIERVITTEHGTIISDILDHSHQKLALNSMALKPGKALWGWMILNHARHWNDFKDAMSYLDAPGLNIVYADVDGNIGYYNTGKMPVKTKEQSAIPMPGWTGENDWDSFVPFAEMPHSINPDRGYIVTCNHKVEPDDFPHYLGDIYMNGYRAVRLEEHFAEGQKFGIEDFTRMQMDIHSIPGKQFAKFFHDISFDDTFLEKARQALIEWDKILKTSSVGGAIYKVTKYHVVRKLYEKDIPDQALIAELLGKGFNSAFGPANTFLGHNTTTLLRLLDRNDESWWIRNYGGREKLLKDGFEAGIAWLKEELGPDISQWHWGKLHHIDMVHALSIQKPLDKIFNVGPFPVGGDTDTPLQTVSIEPGVYGGELAAPSYRQIIDMNDFDRSVSILPNGQSGHLASKHYDDQVDDWLNGRFHPMCWSRAKVEAHRKHSLMLLA